MARMFNPPHPGELLREFLPEGMTIEEVAGRLSVSRVQLSGVFNGRSAVSADMAIRFPGQYYDQETGTHYNYFRDYDPARGRNIESGPIGLKRGIKTFADVGNSPLKYYDPFGLDCWGDDPTLKRIATDDKKVIRLICEAAKDGGASNLMDQYWVKHGSIFNLYYSFLISLINLAGECHDDASSDRSYS